MGVLAWALVHVEVHLRRFINATHLYEDEEAAVLRRACERSPRAHTHPAVQEELLAGSDHLMRGHICSNEVRHSCDLGVLEMRTK